MCQNGWKASHPQQLKKLKECLGNVLLFLNTSVLLVRVTQVSRHYSSQDWTGPYWICMSSHLSHSGRLKQGKQCFWKLALAVVQLPQAEALNVTWVGTAPSMLVVCATNTGWGTEPCFWACLAKLLPFKGASITYAELQIPNPVET